MELRIRLLGILFLVSVVALIARLFFWQILRAGELASAGRLQYQSGQKLLAQRGNILARDESLLAASARAWLIFASPLELKESNRSVANKLAPFFVESEADGMEEATLAEAMRLEGLLTASGSLWIPLKRKVDDAVKGAVAALNIAGIGFEEEETRFYPEASVSAHLLGFVGKDEEGEDTGYFGLEGYYDLTLSGRHGFSQKEADARGLPILFGNSKEVAASGGVDLVTHIDKGVQFLVEKKLVEGLERYGAKSGTAIIMNPENGGIIAMASYPAYDPAKYAEFGDEFFKNPAISDSFEPGSIFKPLVMAAALDAGAIKTDSICDICDGPVKVEKYEIETWDKKYHPDSTVTEILVHSDNVGMVYISQKLGAEKLSSYLEKFGLGRLTGIDLQGEASPPQREKGSWNIVDLATASFGQGIAVTPIQMVRAFANLANGGRLVTPQVVDYIEKDGWKEDIKPEGIGGVISRETAREVTAMMVAAVESGEAKWAVPMGFKIAGKTGTAQIPVKGHYDEEKTIASFIGFAPADNPKFVMLVTLREPTTSPWGSETAAPLWFNIARDLFPYLGIQPEN